ncbi:MAG: tRNA (adenosine(37)-N6)-dimethylallyltransferase MiaA [Candidatus Marinimicrobia bacterium]|nr:tRNA (adenosine(37)-N6)-dimethylallyltransferase MiaA [Candidatus Neomarinimicrobiota bacterium]MCF7904778.1 tRNA (adenosine(37)-N6)-dimethylallyltransferase MiaA [Candidatus Neomarinimicrobiota bacterium]
MEPITIQGKTIHHPDADYLILAGPTAVGKTTTVTELADQYDLEIISGDSRQIYQHMDIGTATPDAELLDAFPHHLLNELTPDVVWNAADFYQRARELVADILERGKLPVVVGGSGMYLEALRSGLFDEQNKDPAVRKKYQSLVDSGKAEELWEELRQIDPEYAESFHFNNHKKLMRAFEIYESTGLPPSEAFQKSSDSFDKQEIFIVLDRDRSILYERINQRVLHMIEAGLIKECERLVSRGYSTSLYPMQTIGYKEVFDFLKGKLDKEAMIFLIQKNSRNFAKRQLTWFRNHPFHHWIDLGAD